MIILVLSCVSVCFIIIVLKFFYELWWKPIYVQSALRSQGIKGPQYRFFHGNSKELIRMSNESLTTPMELSHQMLQRLQPHCYFWKKLYGSNCVYWLGPRPRLIITEPNLAKEIMNKDDLYPKPEFESYLKNLFGDGLVTANGEKWFRLRKLANHIFHGESLKGMTPAMIAATEMMLERWRQHEAKEIDVYEEFKLLTSEIISRTAFGSSYLEGQHIFDMLSRLILILYRNNYLVKIPLLKKFLKTKDDMEADRIEDGIRDSIMKMIKKREEEAKLRQVDSYGSDFLGVLIKANRDMDKTKQISIEDLIDECKTFYIAGQETTSSALAWNILLLAIHMDWQEKAREEILELFGQRNPTLDEISRLKIMNMIINETLRLYSPSITMMREVHKGTRLGKLVAPARMDVLVSILALHHDPEIWGEDVHLFKPERFAEGVAKATRNNIAAFCPFGLGPRNCVGMSFSMAETKIVLSMILQRYRFTLSPNYVHSPIVLIAVSPQKGLQVTLQPL
ncbi:cytochrome P450 CYP749A22 [Manihot esculenta]|uniref:Uncharacterized protein n=1 Tax=Manihot esculenta TaxID=3983 RepID=A0ACB7HNP3_MANES|nr:cytochrome P450 CYP749A22 [Manihot esculenta]KAG8654247.1 hypothetical protein MANES_05G111100v8 [Manihot esculenta]